MPKKERQAGKRRHRETRPHRFVAFVLHWFGFVRWVIVWHVLPFPRDWFITRTWRNLLLGIPAILLAAIPLLLFFHMGTTGSERALMETYKTAAENALGAEDYETATLCFRRLAHINASEHETIYGLALTAEQQGQIDRCRKLLRRIAPADRSGYPPAHYWLANDRLSQEPPIDGQEREILLHDLKQATDARKHRVDAWTTLSRLYAAGGDTRNAVTSLEQAVPERPELRLELAGLYAQQGRAEDAQRVARQALLFHRQQMEEHPDDAGHAICCAWCEMLLGQYSAATKTLETRPDLADSVKAREVLVAVYVAWFRETVEQAPDDLARQLELLDRALKYGPENPQVLAFLGQLASRDWDDSARAIELLEQVLASETPPVLAHMILGTHLLGMGETERGLMHLELARDSNLQLPAVLNNLAWGITQQAEPDLDRALQLALAAEELSDHPEIKHTVGVILARLGRTREAIGRLETSLRAFPTRSDIHTQLAELYRELGDFEMARQHSELAGSDASPDE